MCVMNEEDDDDDNEEDDDDNDGLIPAHPNSTRGRQTSRIVVSIYYFAVLTPEHPSLSCYGAYIINRIREDEEFKSIHLKKDQY